MFEHLLAFAATTLVVILVPGPDMMLVLRNASRAGRTGALWTVIGIMSALALLASAAALGITALVSLNRVVFHIVRIAGAFIFSFSVSKRSAVTSARGTTAPQTLMNDKSPTKLRRGH